MIPKAPFTYSEKFPPVELAPTGLDSAVIEVVHQGGKLPLDTSLAIMAALHGPKGFNLPKPTVPSVLSGELGYVVRLDWAEIPMTVAEMCRYFLRNLTPEEFFTLARKYGVFYEISDKFYDERTGIALDPKYTFAEQDARDALAGAPHLVIATGVVPTMHSLMSQEHADQAVRLFAEEFGIAGKTLALLTPENGAVPITPFRNAVAVIGYVDGTLAAYGPFDNVESARSYRPAEAEGGKAVRFSHASNVTATVGNSN